MDLRAGNKLDSEYVEKAIKIPELGAVRENSGVMDFLQVKLWHVSETASTCFAF